MFQVVLLLMILAVVLIVSRLATIALTVTGIPREIARFQARSALTGAGFTTTESESIVNHPARRKIVMLLMLTGSLGGAAGIATTISAFVQVSPSGGVIRGTGILVGLGVGVLISRTRLFDRVVSKGFAGVVKRIADVDLHDYAGMLRLSGDYAVNELFVEQDDWLADKTLAELDLPHEGLLVLGIVHPDHSYLGAPQGVTKVQVGDTLLMYGRVSVLAELDDRRGGYAGERAHRIAVAEQRAIEEEQRRKEAEEAA